MKNSDLFWALHNMDEDLIEEALVMNKKRPMRPIKMALIAAIVVILLAGTVQAIVLYARSAELLEHSWNETADEPMAQEQKDYIEERSAASGESVTDNGITITMDSITCTETEVTLILGIESAQKSSQEEDYTWSIINCYAENPEWGTQRASFTNNHLRDSNNEQWNVTTCTFSDLPEEARLNDGNTSLHIEITEVSGGTEGALLEGLWSFEVPLPESDSTERKEATSAMRFSSDVTLEIMDITVTDTAVSFAVDSNTERYNITGATAFADMMRNAEPDTTILTIEARAADGSMIPFGSAGRALEEATGLDLWNISWAAPLDPSQITALIFSDGITAVEIPLESP